MQVLQDTKANLLDNDEDTLATYLPLFFNQIQATYIGDKTSEDIMVDGVKRRRKYVCKVAEPLAPSSIKQYTAGLSKAFQVICECNRSAVHFFLLVAMLLIFAMLVLVGHQGQKRTGASFN